MREKKERERERVTTDSVTIDRLAAAVWSAIDDRDCGDALPPEHHHHHHHHHLDVQFQSRYIASFS